MLSSILVSLVAIVFLILFILYKRNFLPKTLHDNSITMTNQFRLQLEQTADAVITQLETKIAHLENLLDEADYKIIELERRLKAVDAVVSVNDWQKSRQPEQITALDEEQNQAHNQTITEIGDPSDQDVINETNPDDDNKRGLVLAMAEQGYNITEIAKATGKGKGEIMLLLQLNKR